MPQQMIHQCNSHHGLCDWSSSDTHAGIMPPSRDYFRRIAFYINCLSWNSNAGCRFQCNVSNDILACTDTTQDAAGVVAFKALRTHQIAMFGTLLFNAVKTGANLNAFDGIDTHQAMSQFCIKSIEHRFTQSYRHSRCDDGDASAN